MQASITDFFASSLYYNVLYGRTDDGIGCGLMAWVVDTPRGMGPAEFQTWPSSSGCVNFGDHHLGLGDEFIRVFPPKLGTPSFFVCASLGE